MIVLPAFAAPDLGVALPHRPSDGYADVRRANILGAQKRTEEGRAFIAKLRALPAENRNLEERQSVDMAEYAFLRHDTGANKARCIECLKAVYDSCPTSFWGWAAFKSENFEYAYVVNGEEYTAEGFTVEAEQAVLDAITALKGNNGSRFMGVLPTEKLVVGENTVQFIVKLDEDITQVIREYKVVVNEKVTEPPTEPPTEPETEAPTEPETEAPETEAPEA